MNQAEFLLTVHKHISGTIDGEGLGLSGYCWVIAAQPDGSEGVELMALDLTPTQIWEIALTRMSHPDTRKLLFVMDRFTKPGQGTTLSDVLTGLYFEAGGPVSPRPFIVEYATKPSKRVLWFNWANHFWNAQIDAEMRHHALDMLKQMDARGARSAKA